MKTCPYCGKALHPDAAYCDGCGNAVATMVPAADRGKEALDSLCRFMKFERLAYKILGIVMLVLGCVYVGLMLVVGLVVLVGGEGMGMFTGFMGFVYMGFVYGGVFLAVGIVNLVLKKKVSALMDTCYSNPSAAIRRCGSVGTIVLAAFFNEIALIFVIINFVKTKTNRGILAQYTNNY